MYLDPSFGGMLLQIIVAIAAVGGTLIYSLRKKISALFSRKNRAIQGNDKQEKVQSAQIKEDLIDMLSNDNGDV